MITQGAVGYINPSPNSLSFTMNQGGLLAKHQRSACRDALATGPSYFEPLPKAGALSVIYVETPAKIRKNMEEGNECHSEAR